MAALRLPWTLLALALAFRLGSLWMTKGTPLAGDEREYYVLAMSLVRGEPMSPLAGRPPLLPAFFGSVLAATDASLYAVRAANAIVGALLVLPAHALGRALGGARTAAVAALFVAVYPSFVTTSHGLWSEPVYLLLTATALALIIEADAAGGRATLGLAALAGFLLASAALTREVGLLFPVLAALWLVVRRRAEDRRKGAAALLLVAFAACILPWTAYINGHAGARWPDGSAFDPGPAPFALLSRTTWENLYVGNAPPPTVLDRFGRAKTVTPRQHYYTLGQTRLETEAAARLLAMDAIVQRLPGWPFEKLASELPDLLAPTSFTQRRLVQPADGADAEWAYHLRPGAISGTGPRRLAAYGVATVYAAAAVVGVLGLALLAWRRDGALLCLFALAHVAPCIATFAISRFRLPIMLVLLIGAAWATTHVGALRSMPAPQRAVAATCAVAVALTIGLQWSAVLRVAWG